MEKLRVFEAFAGYGSQSMALERLGIDFEVVGISEIDKYAIQAYNAVHGETKNYGDISKIDWNEVPNFDLFTYSFPCFPKGTLVETSEGFKPIESIKEGDMVLTHTNKYQKVLATGSRVGQNMCRINAMMPEEFTCTGNHPFYSRRMYRKGHKAVRCFKEPEWKAASELDKKDYLGYAINTESRLPEWKGIIDNRWGHHKKSNMLSNLFSNPTFWYIMGRYIGDGWKKNSVNGSGIIICCSDRNKHSLTEALNSIGWNYCENQGKTVCKIIISSNELNAFVDRFGYLAYGKKIDAETINLPTDLLKRFIDGIVESDGCHTLNETKITSVSRELIYGIQQCVAKVYHIHSRIYKTKRKPKTVIEGRTVNQRDTYSICFHEERRKQDHAFYENGIIWFPINKIERFTEDTIVYNMEVDKDNSYTANGCIVHNCQDISNAGVQRGLKEGSGTRSSLLWECKKAIEAKRPKYLLMENVKALTSKKFLPYLNKWTAYLESLGYTCYTKILNSKNYGVPQNRDRCFMVSILGDETFFFPEGFPLETRLKDVLEKNVDEKYYFSNKLITGFLKTSNNPNHCHKFTPKNGDDIAFTIRTKAGSRVDLNYIKVDTDSVNLSCMHSVIEPKPKRLGNIYGEKCGTNFAGNVWDKEGISPSLTTMGGGNREPMIIEPLNTDKDGLARTIKAQYYKNGMANLKRQDECGATGVIEISEPMALGYTRDKKGKVIDRHLMKVVNTIHTSIGQGGNTDCYIAEPKIDIIGNYHDSGHSASRVVGIEGISPTVMENHGTVTAIAEPQVLTPKRTEYGKSVRKAYESGELEESRHNMTEMQPRTDGIANTVTTVQKDNLLAEPIIYQIPRGFMKGNTQKISPSITTSHWESNNLLVEPKETSNVPLRIPQATSKGYIEVEPGGIFDGSYPESKTRRGRVQDGGRIYPTITSQGEPLNVYEGITEHFNEECCQNYRIRKLTPRECFRLMGVSDLDIDKIEKAGISRTQQYKMAGNSIVVDVLCHIFRKMFVEKECESVQLSLF